MLLETLRASQERPVETGTDTEQVTCGAVDAVSPNTCFSERQAAGRAIRLTRCRVMEARVLEPSSAAESR